MPNKWKTLILLIFLTNLTIYAYVCNRCVTKNVIITFSLTSIYFHCGIQVHEYKPIKTVKDSPTCYHWNRKITIAFLVFFIVNSHFSMANVLQNTLNRHPLFTLMGELFVPFVNFKFDVCFIYCDAVYYIMLCWTVLWQDLACQRAQDVYLFFLQYHAKYQPCFSGLIVLISLILPISLAPWLMGRFIVTIGS